MTTDIRDTIEKALNDSYYQGLDNAIGIVGTYRREIVFGVNPNPPEILLNETLLKIISHLQELKELTKPNPTKGY